MPPLTIIYVAGSGHSGSTLLGRLLDQHPLIASIGSIDGIRTALEERGRFCSCGEDSETCPWWKEIFERLQQAGITDGSGLDLSAPNCAEISHEVLRAISETGGGAHVCEATHNRKRPWFYARSGFADVYVVHLVRDPRGVAFSYERKGQSIWSLIGSLYQNALTHELNRLKFLRNRRVHYRRVHYEDLCADPIGILGEIARFVGLSPAGFDPAKLTVGQSHLLQGNRMRHRPLGEIRQSTTFVTGTSAKWWGIATALTFPLLVRYRYPLSRRAILPRPCEAATF